MLTIVRGSAVVEADDDRVAAGKDRNLGRPLPGPDSTIPMHQSLRKFSAIQQATVTERGIEMAQQGQGEVI